jgi:hypothetical protein
MEEEFAKEEQLNNEKYVADDKINQRSPSPESKLDYRTRRRIEEAKGKARPGNLLFICGNC